MIMQKTNFSFYFKEESVTVWQCKSNLNQFLSFNCYSLQSRKKFYKFKDELANSTPSQYNNINDIYGLARRFDIRASNGHKPTIIKTIAF
jgi:hypothetical protein